MKIRKCRNSVDYKNHSDQIGIEQAELIDYQNSFIVDGQQEFSIPGFSYTANVGVNFLVDYMYSNGSDINWRERLVCPVTSLNNRSRASIQVMDSVLGLYDSDEVYISEQVTPIYEYLSSRYSNIVGSEYLGPDAKPGYVSEDGLRHENLCDLSFDGNSYDAVLTFDCLEHLPDYSLAFEEIYRVLKPGGKLFFSIPFDVNNENNVVRAQVLENGDLNHILPPVYHGDPINDDGVLVYNDYGWDLLGVMRSIGYVGVFALFVSSKEFGYLGVEQIFFVADKPA
jgi:SAM-dependent methyltransferase